MKIQLQPAKLEEFEQVYQLMTEAFPSSERRTEEGQRHLLQNENYHLEVCRDDEGKVCAFMAYWTFEEFRYAEHFAVSAKLRGQKIGEKLLQLFLERDQIPLVLEVEPPETEIARRRIGFYQRTGCVLNEFFYLQPSLQQGQEAILLKIMSYPEAISEAMFEICRKTLYQEVYQVAGEQMNLFCNP